MCKLFCIDESSKCCSDYIIRSGAVRFWSVLAAAATQRELALLSREVGLLWLIVPLVYARDSRHVLHPVETESRRQDESCRVSMIDSQWGAPCL